MRSTRLDVLLLGLVLSLGLARADDEPQGPARGERPSAARRQAAVHGGQVAEIGGLLVEVVLAHEEVRVYLYDPDGAPLGLGNASGRIELTAANVVERGRKRFTHQTTGLKLEQRGKSPSHGRLRPYLGAKHELGAEGYQAARMTLSLAGLPGGRSGEAELTFPRTTPDKRWVCPDGCGGDDARFLDPGECPKCKKELAPEGQGAAEDGSDAGGGRRRWPRR